MGQGRRKQPAKCSEVLVPTLQTFKNCLGVEGGVGVCNLGLKGPAGIPVADRWERVSSAGGIAQARPEGEKVTF